MSDSVRPHRWQPTRLLHPWDSPGKHTGVGCHFLLQCMKVKSESEVAQSCPTLRDPMDCSLPGSSVPHGILQARVPGVGCHCLLLGETWGEINYPPASCRSLKSQETSTEKVFIRSQNLQFGFGKWKKWYQLGRRKEIFVVFWCCLVLL